MTHNRTSEDVPVTIDLALEGAPAPDTTAPASKIARVTEMLQRSGGTTLAKLVATTGWLPHTTRAALTGLRKKGHITAKESREGVTVYSIVKAAS